MSDYSVTYDGAALDAANATITGAALDTEFDNIATMSATKANKVGSPTTGNLLKQSSTGDLVDAAIAYDDVVTLSGTSQTVTGSFADLGTVTTIDINGGSIDGTAIGASSRSTGAFTTLGANSTVTFSGGGAMTGTWTNLGSVTTIDINGGTIDGTTIGASSATTGTFAGVTTKGTSAAQAFIMQITDDSDTPLTISKDSNGNLVGYTRSVNMDGAGAGDLDFFGYDSVILNQPFDLSASTAGQIVFPATQNASSNANTLDDYEESTWTPSVGGTATYVEQYGVYTKIGRLVTFSGICHINTIGTGSSSTISGLPFSISHAGTPVTVYWSTTAATYVYLVGYISGTSITLYGATAAASSLTSASAMQDSTTIHVSGSYIV